MIEEIVHGNITNKEVASGDIIIAMNTKLSEASAIGRPFVRNRNILREIKLGSVLTFNFDDERLLHMLICHRIGRGGWANAEKYVRFCLDYLWQQHNDKKYSIVQIGKGHIGRRDGANVPAIRTAMADSFLRMDLVILPEMLEAQAAVGVTSMVPFRVWDMERGEREIRATVN